MHLSALDQETEAGFAAVDLASELGGGMCLLCGDHLPYAQPDDAALCAPCAVDEQAYHEMLETNR